MTEEEMKKIILNHARQYFSKKGLNDDLKQMLSMNKDLINQTYSNIVDTVKQKHSGKFSQQFFDEFFELYSIEQFSTDFKDSLTATLFLRIEATNNDLFEISDSALKTIFPLLFSHIFMTVSSAMVQKLENQAESVFLKYATEVAKTENSPIDLIIVESPVGTYFSIKEK